MRNPIVAVLAVARLVAPLAASFAAVLALSPAAQAQEPPADAQPVVFPGPDGSPLRGFLYVPPGRGPFPAVLWNHGTEQYPGWQPELARFYTSEGFVFFIPHRRGQGRSVPGPNVVERVQAINDQMKDATDGERRFVALHEEIAREVDAAVAWLKKRPEVDPNAIVMSGCSFGGVQTLLAAEKRTGVRAFVAFAPGARSWRNVRALGERMRRAARAAKAPVLVIQAENDYDLTPTRVLGEDLKRRRDRSATLVYPAFGWTPEEGHGAFATTDAGIYVWGPDVVAFFKLALGSAGGGVGRKANASARP